MTTVLFVDDEASIRLTLPAILRNEGFDVSVVASVPEAIQMIQTAKFDILLSDLNIGEPGDGFTVVSAMRRIQPEAATFILTGYPDFESALVAIRNQVDDYLIKPADINKLVQTFREVARRPRKQRRLPSKRVSVIIRETRDGIVDKWYERAISHHELSQLELPRGERVDHIPGFLLEIADCIDVHSMTLSESALKAAGNHGALRYHQGYTIPMLIVESSILERTISETLQDHLLAIDISNLIPDLRQMSQAINCGVETSVRAFLNVDLDSKMA